MRVTQGGWWQWAALVPYSQVPRSSMQAAAMASGPLWCKRAGSLQKWFMTQALVSENSG